MRKFFLKNDVVVETRTDKSMYVMDEDVSMSVAVTNAGSSLVELVFGSAQRYDFVVLKDGDEVWRWSQGRVFAMNLGLLYLEPGEKQFFRETWKLVDVIPGCYTLKGMITSQKVGSSTCTFKVVDGKSGH